MVSRPALAVLVVAAFVLSGLSAFADDRGSGPVGGPTGTFGLGGTHAATAPEGRGAAPALSRAAPMNSHAMSPVGPALSPAWTTINPDGSISNSSAPITRTGNTYTVTASFIGGILDERNGSTIWGKNNTVQADASIYEGVEVLGANNVTIEYLGILSAHEGFLVVGSSHVRIANVVVLSSWDSLVAELSSQVTIQNLSCVDSEGMYFWEVDGVVLTDVNATLSTDWAFDIEESSDILIKDSTAFESDEGIYLWEDSNTTVWGTNLTDTEYGMELYDAYATSVDWVNCSFSYYVIYAEESTGLWTSHDTGAYDDYFLYFYQVSDFASSWDAFPHMYDYAIYFDVGTDIAISNDSFQHAYYTGVEAYDVQNFSLTDTNASYFEEEGIYVYAGSNVRLIGDSASVTISSYGEGIYTGEIEGLTIANCTARDDEYGIDDEYSAHVTISGDDVSHGTNMSYALYLEEEADATVTDVNAFNSSYYGIDVEEDSGLWVLDSNFSRAGYTGMYIDESDNVTLAGNWADHAARYGLDIYDGSGLSVTGNHFEDAIGSLDGTALYVEDEANVVISGNWLQSSAWELELEEDLNITASGNNASGGTYGLYVDDVANGWIVGNEFADNTYGFAVGWDSGVWIYHNNFVGDAGWQNYSSLNEIHWSAGYPIGGNYWSNHTGPDTMSGPGQNITGSDGIVDTPMVINTTNVDQYPLTTPWTNPTATFTESGLSAGTAWSVTVGGTKYWSTGTTLAIVEQNGANGSVAYSVGHVAGYDAPSPAAGSLSEHRGNLAVAITFTPATFSVTFRETGLSAGKAWSVTVGGHPLDSTTSNATTTLANGTYAWTAAAVTGFALTTPYGNLTVAGHTVTITVAYENLTANSTGNGGKGGGTGTTSSSSSNSFSNNEVYGLIGLLVLALLLAIVGFAMWARGRRPPSPPAQAWSPPSNPPTSGGSSPPPPAGGSPPPGAMGGNP